MLQVSVFYTLWKQKNYVTTSTVVKDNTGGQQHRETTNKTGQLWLMFFSDPLVPSIPDYNSNHYKPKLVGGLEHLDDFSICWE